MAGPGARTDRRAGAAGDGGAWREQPRLTQRAGGAAADNHRCLFLAILAADSSDSAPGGARGPAAVCSLRPLRLDRRAHPGAQRSTKVLRAVSRDSQAIPRVARPAGGRTACAPRQAPAPGERLDFGVCGRSGSHSRRSNASAAVRAGLDLGARSTSARQSVPLLYTMTSEHPRPADGSIVACAVVARYEPVSSFRQRRPDSPPAPATCAPIFGATTRCSAITSDYRCR